MPLVKDYMGPILWILPCFAFSQMLAAFLRSDDAPRLVAAGPVAGAVFNMAADIIFVFGFDMGLRGAGLATAISEVIIVGVMAVHFMRPENTLKFRTPAGFLKKCAAIAANGISPCILDMAQGAVAIFYNWQVLKLLGINAMGVFGVIVEMTGIVQRLSYGASQVCQPILSTNHAAMKPERVAAVLRYSLATVACLGIASPDCSRCFRWKS